MPRSKRDSPLPSFSRFSSVRFHFSSSEMSDQFSLPRAVICSLLVSGSENKCCVLRRAQTVLRAKVALIGATTGGNKLEHPVEIFLAYVKRDVNGPAMPFRPIRKCVDLLDRQKLMIGKFKEVLILDYADEFQTEGFVIKLFGFSKSLVSKTTWLKLTSPKDRRFMQISK